VCIYRKCVGCIELNQNSVTYKERHMCLFLDVKCEQYIWTIHEYYLSMYFISRLLWKYFLVFALSVDLKYSGVEGRMLASPDVEPAVANREQCSIF
jgi:hypothetical protein